MPNKYLSVLNKHIIQVENKNVGLKVRGGGTNIPLPPNKKVPPPPPPASYASALGLVNGCVATENMKNNEKSDVDEVNSIFIFY